MNNMVKGVVADAEELIKFADRLRSFNQIAGSNVSLLNSQFNRLGESWRDEEYKKFEAEFTSTMKTVMSFFAACERYEHYLRKKAQPLDRYGDIRI